MMKYLAILLCANLPVEDKLFFEVQVHTAEINTYGTDPNPQTCVLFRDSAGMIMDWRWWKKPKYPKSTMTGVRMGNRLFWEESDKGRIVKFKHIKWTRTLHDVELRERNKYPDHKRVPLFKR